MKNIKSFLKKLNREEKLKSVESSDDIKEAYLKKSESNLISAKILLKNNRLEESVSLLYYSMYNLLMALLFKTGIKSENHSASIALLKDIFDMDNSTIVFAKKERIDKQYYIDFNVTMKEVEDLIKDTEKFSEELINFISRLTTEKVNFYKNKFINLIK